MLDDKFGLSDADISEEQCEEVYAYRGRASSEHGNCGRLIRGVESPSGCFQEFENEVEREQLDPPSTCRLRVYSDQTCEIGKIFGELSHFFVLFLR